MSDFIDPTTLLRAVQRGTGFDIAEFRYEPSAVIPTPAPPQPHHASTGDQGAHDDFRAGIASLGVKTPATVIDDLVCDLVRYLISVEPKVAELIAAGVSGADGPDVDIDVLADTTAEFMARKHGQADRDITIALTVKAMQLAIHLVQQNPANIDRLVS